MYSLAPEYSKTRRPEKCSTLIGSGTAAWCLYSGGVVRFIIRFQTSSACRSQPFSLADISGVILIFQLLADGDNNLYLDTYRIYDNQKAFKKDLCYLSRKPIGLVTFLSVVR